MKPGRSRPSVWKGVDLVHALTLEGFVAKPRDLIDEEDVRVRWTATRECKARTCPRSKLPRVDENCSMPEEGNDLEAGFGLGASPRIEALRNTFSRPVRSLQWKRLTEVRAGRPYARGSSRPLVRADDRLVIFRRVDLPEPL